MQDVFTADMIVKIIYLITITKTCVLLWSIGNFRLLLISYRMNSQSRDIRINK